LEPALASEQCREQADGAGTDDQRGLRLEALAVSDGFGLLPGLGDHGRRLEQHPEPAEGGIDAHDSIGMCAVTLAHEAVELFDAVLDVATVATGVPFALRTGVTGH